MRVNDFQIMPHFNLMEFQCPCCGTVKVHRKLAEALQRLRIACKRPVELTSGYRCARHNAEIGGARNSRHLKGLAADIAVPSQLQDVMERLALSCGFTKVIAYPERSFLHLELNDG